MVHKVIVIPELEEEAIQVKLAIWSPKDIEIMKKYYNRVSLSSIKKYLPGKTDAAIRNRAAVLGLSRKKGDA